MAMIFGPVILAVGLCVMSGQVGAWLDFHGKPRIRAVVEQANYKKAGQQEASSVMVGFTIDGRQKHAWIDDAFSAPDGLSAGDRVTVLFDADRPGHALFPAQLGWNMSMLFWVVWVLIGLVATTRGVIELNALIRRTRAATS
jgi:hypothetical protein